MKRFAAPLVLLIAVGTATGKITIEAINGGIEPGVVRVSQTDGNSSGVIIGPELVLTSSHGTERGSVRVEGREGKVIASDADADLALVRVSGLEGTPRPVASADDAETGSATLYGFPSGDYRVSSGSVDRDGDLDFTVYAGNSGGPLIKDGKVIGILIRYHGVATASQIRSFLKLAGHGELFAGRDTSRGLRIEALPRTASDRKKD